MFRITNSVWPGWHMKANECMSKHVITPPVNNRLRCRSECIHTCKHTQTHAHMHIRTHMAMHASTLLYMQTDKNMFPSLFSRQNTCPAPETTHVLVCLFLIAQTLTCGTWEGALHPQMFTIKCSILCGQIFQKVHPLISCRLVKEECKSINRNVSRWAKHSKIIHVKHLQ